jgi:predicted RNA-binding protein with PIN domain
MHYLIDGYNLLHAVGIVGPELDGRITLDYARRQLLEMVYKAHREEPEHVTVVFDAARAAKKRPESSYKGIHVEFAVNYHQADDLIEVHIKRTAQPRDLTVVSNDHRIQNAADRKGCRFLDCGRYMDVLNGTRPLAKSAPNGKTVKPESVSDVERAHWLREFAELENDPALKELSDPQEFMDDDDMGGTP